MRPSPDTDSNDSDIAQENENLKESRFNSKIESIVKTHFIAIRQVILYLLLLKQNSFMPNTKFSNCMETNFNKRNAILTKLKI